MEPRGCNGWQSAANRPAFEIAETSEIRCDRLPPVACDVHGRRGSPVRVRKRALTKAPHTRGFPLFAPLNFVQHAQIWNRFWKETGIRLVEGHAAARVENVTLALDGPERPALGRVGAGPEDSCAHAEG